MNSRNVTVNPASFCFSDFDAELSSRMITEEWKRILSMREHPHFLKALTQYEAIMPAYFANNIVLNRVVTEAWRFEILVYALYLHDTRDPDDFRSGLTMANLQRLCLEQKCASRGRVFAIVGLMLAAGYLRRMRSSDDSRVVHLEPSQKFIAIVEGWNSRIFTIIDAVYAEPSLAVWHQTDERFGWEMRKRGAERLLTGWKLLDPFPEVVHFVSRDGGWMFLLTCVARSLKHGAELDIQPVSLDLKAYGMRFGVSRSHLRRLLESAHKAGLLDAPPNNGSNILLSRKLVVSFLTCMASELENYRSHALAALAEMQG